MATVTIQIVDNPDAPSDLEADVMISLSSVPTFPATSDDATPAQLFGAYAHGQLMDMLKTVADVSTVAGPSFK